MISLQQIQKNVLTLGDCVLGLNPGTKFRGLKAVSGFDAIFLKNQLMQKFHGVQNINISNKDNI